MPGKTFHVYILASRTRVLDVGVTSDLEKRIWEHKHKAVHGFTATYNVNRLVLLEETADALAAITREKQIKGWLRAKKVALIGVRAVTVRATAPVFTPDPSGCSALR